jgi:hypothetical protein
MLRSPVLTTVSLAMAWLVLAGSSLAVARGGGHGGHGHSHRHSSHGTAQPANPSVPPALTPDGRLTGSAPLPAHQQPRRGSAPVVSEKRDPEDLALDRKIGSICRGC